MVRVSLGLTLLAVALSACSGGGSPGSPAADASADAIADGGATGQDAGADAPVDAAPDAPGDATPADASPPTDVDAGSGVSEERFGFVGVGADGLTYLWDMRIDGTDMRTLPMAGQYGIAEASWSGDGRRVAFTTYDETYTNSLDELLPVMVMNTDGTGLEQVGAGRFPSFNGDATFLAWVSHSLRNTTDDPPRAIRKYDLHTHYFDGRTPVRLGGSPGGSISTGPGVSEGITQLKAAPSGDPAIWAFYSNATPIEGGFVEYGYAILKFRDGGVDVVAEVEGQIEGLTFFGADHTGDGWWAEWQTVGEERKARIVSSTSRTGLDFSQVSPMVFSPNAIRSLQSSGGFNWIGTPTFEDQTQITFGLPTRGVSSWFVTP